MLCSFACGDRASFKIRTYLLIKRTIQRELQDPLALKILAGEFREGDVIEVDRGRDELVFSTAVQGEVVEA